MCLYLFLTTIIKEKEMMNLREGGKGHSRSWRGRVRGGNGINTVLIMKFSKTFKIKKAIS